MGPEYESPGISAQKPENQDESREREERKERQRERDKEIASRIRRNLRQAANDLAEYVEENPVKAVIVAGTVGFMIGLLRNRRR